jgi:arginine repressor
MYGHLPVTKVRKKGSMRRSYLLAHSNKAIGGPSQDKFEQCVLSLKYKQSALTVRIAVGELGMSNTGVSDISK